MHAKIDQYTSLDQLENDSDIIVYGKKVEENAPSIIKNANDEVIAQYTLSHFKIQKIEKNNKNVSVGNTITILENEAYNNEDNITYHIAGYKKMITGKNYMLFLKYADENKWYVPTGVNPGKVPQDKSEPLVILGNDQDANIQNINNEAREAYYLDK